ncbi:uncharacterized protein LOC115996085 [Ipomoea triloba]|uniref:uncharacterized protein LOC115996085 n=1 Tax=Ipomoea triloba TaxID=35885 RepID=UPI00125E0F7D|nr:uncharacterized protein LOC115996085 [Ipomoea triloba]
MWKTFMWRALSNILLVTTNLLLKRVEVEPECPMCGIVHEDVMHALVSCDFTQLVWHESQLILTNTMGNSFPMWFTNLMTLFTEDHISYAVAILYFVWKARNNAVWDDFLPSPKRVAASALAALRAWKAVAQGHQSTSGLSVAEGEAAIQGVPIQLAEDAPLLCFFDASYDPLTLQATFGAVLLDPGGGYVAACAGQLIDCFSPLMAETVACKEVLIWLVGRGVASVQLKMDCSQLCSGLSKMQSSFYSYVGLYIDACMRAIATFSYCHISLVSRSVNVIAHSLTSAAVR